MHLAAERLLREAALRKRRNLVVHLPNLCLSTVCTRALRHNLGLCGLPGALLLSHPPLQMRGLLSRLLALRGTPPFDTRPTLLYEVIAHTLEEEVRALRTRLHERLGVSPAIPREGGCFDGDDAVLHRDALAARAARDEAAGRAAAEAAGARRRT